MSRRPYAKFLLAGVSAAAVLVGAQVARADAAGIDVDDDPYEGPYITTEDITTTSDDDAGVDFKGKFAGDFFNQFSIKATIGDGADGVLFEDTFDGTFTNEEGAAITGGSIGVDFNDTFDGTFTNEEGAAITGITDDGVLFLGAFGGNSDNSSFINDGDITGGFGGVAFFETFDGNFTNTGNIEGDATGVGFAGAFGSNNPDSNFTNEGNISSASIGVWFENTFTGNFTNSGTITTSGTEHALRVEGDFTGDLINTGDISGTGTNYIYIGGDFKGNMTQPVGVRVDVGGKADLSDKTYTVHVDADGDVAHDYTWVAIDTGTGVNLTDYTLNDDSLDLTFYDFLSTDNALILTTKIDGVKSDLATCGDYGLTQEVEDALNSDDYDDFPNELRGLVTLMLLSGEEEATIADYSPISGPGHGVLGNSQQFIDNLAGRLRPNNANTGPGTWGGVIGGVGAVDTCSGYDTITAGVIGGFEGPVNEDIRVGVALAYLYANVDGKEGLRGDEANIHSLGPALYARYQIDGIYGLEFIDGLYAQGSVAGAYSFIDQTRVALVTGEQFDANYGGFSVSGRVEVGYDVSLGQGYLTPYAAAGSNFVALDGYSESGGGDGLDVSDFDGAFPMLEGGFRAGFIGEQVGLSALAGYRHEFGDEDIRASASLDSTSFDTSTTLHSVGSGFISGLEANAWYGNAMFGLSYDGLFGADRVSHIGSVNFSFHI